MNAAVIAGGKGAARRNGSIDTMRFASRVDESRSKWNSKFREVVND